MQNNTNDTINVPNPDTFVKHNTYRTNTKPANETPQGDSIALKNPFSSLSVTYLLSSFQGE